MFCKYCGKEIEKNSKFCSNCGVLIGEKLATTAKNRIFHHIFDTVTHVTIFIIILILYKEMHIENDAFMNFIFGIFLISWLLLYYPFFEYIFQKTPAKFLTKTKVVDFNGEAPSFYNILIRSVSRLIPLEIFSFFQENPLGWHDILSKTLVVPDNYTKKEIKNINKEKIFLKPLLIISISLIFIAIIGLLAGIIIIAMKG